MPFRHCAASQFLKDPAHDFHTRATSFNDKPVEVDDMEKKGELRRTVTL